MTYIIEFFCIIAGVFYIFMGISKYGLWKGISISGGFMPFICGGAIIILAVFMLISKRKKSASPEKMELKVLLPIGAMLLILILNYILGLIGACIAASFLWLKFVEKYSWLKSITASAILLIFIYAIFCIWLKVPFPTGLLGFIL